MKDYQQLSKAQLIKELNRLQSGQDGREHANEVSGLRHDLEVHHVELEMQNRELREQQQQLELARDKYADLYDFAPVGYLTLDDKGIIREINLTATGLLKTPRSQLLDKPFTTFLGDGNSRDFFRVLREVSAGGEERSLELQLKLKDSPPVDVIMQMAATNVSGVAVVRAVLVDISAKKQIERELIRAKKQAEEANRAKSQFLTRMSHEFRTPLNAILGFAQILNVEGSKLEPSQKEDVEQILVAGWHLLEVVNDLLDLAAIETDKLELRLEAVNLNQRIRDCMDVLQPLARQYEVTQHLKLNDCEGNLVQADPVRLRQLLLNLLSNAVKYNRRGGSITVRCELTGHDTLRANVTDTGLGIAEADLSALFKPFSRLYLKTHALEGTGIGLSIAKQLVERMGGRIGVTSKLDQGSTFWIELPLSHAAEHVEFAAMTIGKESAEAVPEITLLYIEDSPSHVKLMEAIVKNMPGVLLLSAQSPQMGLELAQAHRPDIILLDICLPGMDGFEVMEQLRATDATRMTPVIAVSANAMSADIEKGLGAGFHRYLTKPINITELKKAVGESLGVCAV